MNTKATIAALALMLVTACALVAFSDNGPDSDGAGLRFTVGKVTYVTVSDDEAWVDGTSLSDPVFGGTVTYRGTTYTVTGIQDQAFKSTISNDLKSVTLTDTVRTIGDQAFSGQVDLASVDLGSVQSIGAGAFDN